MLYPYESGLSTTDLISLSQAIGELLGLKTPVVDVDSIWERLGGSIPQDFRFCWFGDVEWPDAYRGDIVDLKGHQTFYRCQAFMVAFFDLVLFPSQVGSISFAVLALVSTLPHSTSFIPPLLFEMIQSLSLCHGTGSGRHCCCVHLQKLWLYSHLSVISRVQPTRFLRKKQI